MVMPTVNHWEIWTTAGDGRVCGNCAHLHGVLFLYGTGPQPPLHPACRCSRTYHHTEVIPDPVAQPNIPTPGIPPSPSPAPLPAPNNPPLPIPWWLLPLLLPLPDNDEEES